jgi:hypothetical protein
MSLEIPVTIVKTAVVAALKLITGVTKTNTADKTMAAAGTPLFEICPEPLVHPASRWHFSGKLVEMTPS